MPSPSGARRGVKSEAGVLEGDTTVQRQRLSDNIRMKCRLRAVGDILMKHQMYKQLVRERSGVMSVDKE